MLSYRRLLELKGSELIDVFLFISTHILLVLFFASSAETDAG